MSRASVAAFFAEHAPDLAVVEPGGPTGTVAQAAAAFGVEPGRIAKTLSLRVGAAVSLVVTAGDARLDNRKLRALLGGKARLLDVAEVERLTGHPVGGVCPFGLATPLPVCCDVSLRHFAEIIPAAGSPTSAVRLSPERLAALTHARWVDVCQDRDEGPRGRDRAGEQA